MLKKLWQTSPALVATGLVMLPLLAAAGIGVLVDPRIVTGMPVWLKPAKFAASIAIYTFTLAWIFSLVPEWTRTRRLVEWITAVTLNVEIIAIAGQAWRGTTSHFNVATPLDTAIFNVMGFAIFLQTFAAVAAAVALWRHRFADVALGWAVRLGFSMSIAGALVGGIMVTPSQEQIATARAAHHMTTQGSHTVGAPDGGPGIPGTGWSTEHGDLRVPHFVGLHAMQGLPFLTFFVVPRRFSIAVRTRLTLIGCASYAALFVILLGQGLRGQSLIAPDAMTIAQFAAWGLMTVVAAIVAMLRPVPARTIAPV